MKLAIIFSFFAAALAIPGMSSVQTWLAGLQQPISNFIDNSFRKSTIPQFILDTKHPWILDNKRKLEGLPNAEAFLCLNLQDHPGNNAPITDLEIPPDLFHNLVIDNNSIGPQRPGWPNAIDRLTEINRCPQALASAKSLYVDVFVYRDENTALWSKIREPCQAPASVFPLFGDVLESMNSLEHLEWGIRHDYAHIFEESFRSRNLTLPSVTSLKLSPLSHFLVAMCPNLERLERGGGLRWNDYSNGPDWKALLIESGVSAPKLKHSAMSSAHAGWSPSMIASKLATPKVSIHIDGLCADV